MPDAPLVGGLAPKLGAKHLRLISFRSFVTETEPGLLDALNRLAISYRWVTRFLPLDREEARKELEKIRKRWFSQRVGLGAMLRAAIFKDEPVLHDNAAANHAADADMGLQELEADAIGAGYTTLTITVAEDDENAADDTVRQIQQVADGLGFVTQVETVNAIEAWLGSLPGSAYADVRRPILLTPSLAHLLPTSAVWAGPERNAHLDGPPLMLTATDGATPFRLDLHAGDVGHTMIVGPTGAGKSVLLAALAAQWRRYPDAQIYLFDKGRSARATILGMAGDFFDLGEDGALGLQPLERIDDPAERAWALDWIAGLIASANLAVTPELRAELWRALEVLGSRPQEDRTLTLYTALVQDASVRAALQPFTHAGPHGRLLDHEQTSLGYGAVQAFEMDDLMRRPQAAGAVLSALFHVLERRFDGSPTLLVLDEAWLFLKDAFFAAQIQDWLKTLRKKNVAVVFASQELADVEASPIASTIIEACLTRIFLPNDRAREPRSRSFYERLGLNGRQIALIGKGNRETARRMRGVLSSVFRLAVIEDVIQNDPSAPLKGVLLPPETRHNSAVTEPEAFGALMRAIDGYDGHKTIKLALQLLALTFPRPGELRQAEWPEVDIKGLLWVIPAPRTKMRREHRIPLSRQAAELFETLKEITGGGTLCFPSIRSLNNPLSDGALNAALRAMGVAGETHVAHGFRSSASSLLNEHSAFSPEVIERALAHGEPDKVRRAYNRAQYWDERVRMMQWWADYMDRLRRPVASALVREVEHLAAENQGELFRP